MLSKEFEALLSSLKEYSNELTSILEKIEKATDDAENNLAKVEATFKYPEIIRKIQKSLDNVHYVLLDCVTSGEYLKRTFNHFNEFVASLQEMYLLSSDISQILNKEDVVLSEEKDFITLVEHRISYLKSCILNDPQTQFIDLSKFESEKFDDRSKLVLLSGLKLEFIDFDITIKRNPSKVLSDLSELIKVFQGNKDKHKLQYEKTLFLMNKLEVFKQIKSKDDTEIIIHNEKIILKDFLKKYQLTKDLSDLIEILSLYDIEVLDQNQYSKLERYVQRIDDENSLSFYFKIKLLKDSNKEKNNLDQYVVNTKQMVSLIEKYKVSSERENNFYDFEADRINKIFLINNFISYSDDWIKDAISSKQVIDIDFITKKITEFEELIHSYESECPRIENYFTYYKLGCLYLSASRYYLENNNIQNSVEAHDKSLKRQKDLDKKFYLLSRFHRFRLRSSEAVIGKEVKVFVYSSVNLPLYFFEQDQRNTKLRNNSFDLSVKIQAAKSDYKLSEASLAYRNEFKAELEDKIKKIDTIDKKVNEDVKKHLFRSTEILSVFAAIVLFTSGSIQLFGHITDVKSAVILMSLFAFFITSSFLIVTVFVSENPGRRFVNILGVMIPLVCAYMGLVWYAAQNNSPLFTKTPSKDMVVTYIERQLPELRKEIKEEISSIIRKEIETSKKSLQQTGKQKKLSLKKNP